MNLRNQIFTTKNVASAANVEIRSVADWATRGLITGHTRGNAGRGTTREFSFESMMEVVVAAHVMQIGINSPKIAFQIARNFAHSGDETRYPAFPFHHTHGNTWLLVSGENTTVLAGGDDDSFSLSRAFPQKLRGFGYIALNVSEIFNSMCVRLNQGNPFTLLDDVYPKEATD